MLQATPTCPPAPLIASRNARRPVPSIRAGCLGAADIGDLRVRDSLEILVPTVGARLFPTEIVPVRARTQQGAGSMAGRQP